MNAQRFWNENGFAIAVALNPPKGSDVSVLVAQTEPLRGRIDAVLVGDATDAIMRMTPLAACAALSAKGMRAILGMNGRDRNRLAVQGDLLGAWSLGVRDVLFEDGKDPSFGDHPLTRPVHDVDGMALVELAAALNRGRDGAGLELAGGTDFNIAAAVEWLDDDTEIEREFVRMGELARKGCSTFVVSPQFDAARTRALVERARPLGAAVLVGVIMLKSVGMARYLNEVPGISRVPDHVIERLASAETKARAGVLAAAEFIDAMKGIADGVVIEPVGWVHKIPEILDAIVR